MLFISHAREDREAAAKLMNELEAEGYDCLIDPDLTEGDPFWREATAQQFLECELMLCLASGCAERSPWVEQEQRAFLGQKLWIAIDPCANGLKMSTGRSTEVVRQSQALSAVCAALPPGRRQLMRTRDQPDRLTRPDERLRHIQEQQARLDTFLRSCGGRSKLSWDIADDIALGRSSSIDLELRAARIGTDGGSTFVGTRPVTNAQYRTFMDASGYERPPTWQRAAFRVDDAPVTGVNWFEACAFAAWVGGTLPTEVDWIRSARGSDESCRFATMSGEIDPTMAYYGQPFGRCAPVAPTTYPPNPKGFHGLCGNTWDWCASLWEQHRVIRGGGYMDVPTFCRIESRYRNAPIDRDCCVGFRVKVELDKTV
jgi:hypothetical protein